MSILMLCMFLNIEIIHKRINIIVITTFIKTDNYQSFEIEIIWIFHLNRRIIIIFDWRNDIKGKVFYWITFFIKFKWLCYQLIYLFMMVYIFGFPIV